MKNDVWVGFWKDCYCVVAICMDEPDHPKDTARDVSDFMRRGYRVYRYSSDQFEKTPWRCEAHPKGTPAPWTLAKAAPA